MRSFWDGFEKKAFAHLHFIHHTGLSPEEREGLHKSVEEVGSFRNRSFQKIKKERKLDSMQFGGKNNWSVDAVEHFHGKYPHLKDKVWVGGTDTVSDKKKLHPYTTEAVSVGDVSEHPKMKEYYANHVGKVHDGVKSLHVGKGFKKEWKS